jgi:CTP synthase (UTP-ammonia lyase)
MQESTRPTRTATVALVGDQSAHVRSHTRIPSILRTLREHDGLALDAYWVSTDEAAGTDLRGFDGIWLLPGSPYRSESGALLAARTAREQLIPHLATCAGFQHTLLEYARTVCGQVHAQHAENDPDADDPLIVPLACSLVGHEGPVHITAGSAAERILGVERTVERYHCAYGLNPAAVRMLSAHGIQFTGHDDEGDVRIAELPGHPFFLATLFQPELAGDARRCHPIVRAFAEACVAHAARRSRFVIKATLK